MSESTKENETEPVDASGAPEPDGPGYQMVEPGLEQLGFEQLESHDDAAKGPRRRAKGGPA